MNFPAKPCGKPPVDQLWLGRTEATAQWSYHLYLSNGGRTVFERLNPEPAE